MSLSVSMDNRVQKPLYIKFNNQPYFHLKGDHSPFQVRVFYHKIAIKTKMIYI
jgi:hypothetical protein